MTLLRVLLPDGSLAAGKEPGLEEAELVALYRAMLRARLLDSRLRTLQHQGRIRFHVPAAGDEAASLGAAFALADEDWLFPGHRDVGAALWRGLPLQRYLDHMFGNASDPAKGRQMPDHFGSSQARVASISSPAGTQISHAVGVGWAARQRKDRVASLVLLAPDEVVSPDFHNGLNFAGVFKAATVVVARRLPSATDQAPEREIAYGVSSSSVDGDDVLAVVAACRAALEQARSGAGTTIIDVLTHEPGPYESWATVCPLGRLRKLLAAQAGWTPAHDEKLEAELDADLTAAIEQAERTPKPALKTAFDDVYAELPWHLREQRDALLSGPRPHES